MIEISMSKIKLFLTAGLIIVILIFVFKVEIVEVGLDEPGYTYIGSASSGVLRVNAETGATVPCMISDGKKARCLSWKK